MPSVPQRRDAARALHRIVELTEVLADDGPPDAALRDRLELAAAVLEAEDGRPKAG